jgi:hypothetical protein
MLRPHELEHDGLRNNAIMRRDVTWIVKETGMPVRTLLLACSSRTARQESCSRTFNHLRCPMMAVKSLEDGRAEPAEASHGSRPSRRRRWLVLGIVLALGLALGLVRGRPCSRRRAPPDKNLWPTCFSRCDMPFEEAVCSAEIKKAGCGCPKDKLWYYSDQKGGGRATPRQRTAPT